MTVVDGTVDRSGRELEMTKVGAILLAAGASRRFGAGSKLVADFHGEPLMRRAARTLGESRLAEIVVVTGHEAQLCRDALQGLQVIWAHNDGWERGMGSSIATGVAALDPGLDGTFIVPGDMPFLGAKLLQKLTDAFSASGARPIVFPATQQGEQRNPVLWPRRFFAELATLTGHEGAKAILQQHASEAVSVRIDDEQEFLDVDTASDLDAARESFARNRNSAKE